MTNKIKKDSKGKLIKMSLNKAFARLEEINRQFESGPIDLEEGMIKLKEGLRLAKFLKKRLTGMENEISKIKKSAQKN